MFRSDTKPVTFIAGGAGLYRVTSLVTLTGEPLAAASHLDVQQDFVSVPGAAWSLRGVTGHVRYVERAEKSALDPASPALGRAEATRAVLIPIRKSAAWWALPQDERRAIFETRSKHIADSMKYLPRIARRLYQSRELGEEFDFLTWFEHAPEHTAAFDELLGMLRSREEWQYVEREVELRLERAPV